MDKDLAAKLSMAQQLDQAMAAIETASVVIRAYYDNLVKVGFTPDQAMTLTLDFQRVTLSNKAQS
jgi:hypothetical protein